MQLTPAQKETLASGLADVKAMDQELQQIQEHQDELAKTPSAREAEIAVLKRRYPEIVLAPGATVRQVYRALYAARMARGAAVLPLAQADLKASQDESCRAAKDLKDTWADIVNAGGLDKMSLSERLEMQKALDALMVPAKDCPNP